MARLAGLSLLLASAPALAGSLDLLEVGGANGTPAASGPTALWWNPAMMSDARGTSFLFEVAPTIGSVSVDRDDPSYGPFGGEETFSTVQAVPFAGVVTDAGVNGLGIGAAVYVPYGRGGASNFEDGGPTNTHLRSAQIQAVHVSMGVSFSILDWVGLGIAGTYVNGTYNSLTETASLPDLADSSEDLLSVACPEDICNDGNLENLDFLVETDLKGLRGHAGAVQAGLFVRPHHKWLISAGFYSGVPDLKHESADAELRFRCPEEAAPGDVFGLLFREGLRSQGLCTEAYGGAVISARGSNTYSFPMRVNGSLRYAPTEKVRLELMGGWVRWSMYDDFHIVVDQIESTNSELTEGTKELLVQDRAWARQNRDSFWVGIDGKFKVHELVRLDTRLAFDRSAVGAGNMSPNNADFDVVKIMAGLEVQTGRKVPVFIGASFTENVGFARTETENLFDVTLDQDNRKEDRYFYPSMNGRYSGQVHRIGVSLRGHWKDKPAR